LRVRFSDVVRHLRRPVVGALSAAASRRPHGTPTTRLRPVPCMCAQLWLPGGALSAKTKETLAKARPVVELLWE